MTHTHDRDDLDQRIADALHHRAATATIPDDAWSRIVTALDDSPDLLTISALPTRRRRVAVALAAAAAVIVLIIVLRPKSNESGQELIFIDDPNPTEPVPPVDPDPRESAPLPDLDRPETPEPVELGQPIGISLDNPRSDGSRFVDETTIGRAGELWTVVERPRPHSARVIVRIDPDTFATTEVRLGLEPHARVNSPTTWPDITQMLAGPDALWAIVDQASVLRIDPRTNQVSDRFDMPAKHGIIADGGLWLGRPGDLARIDLVTLEIETVPHSSPGEGDLHWLGEHDGSLLLLQAGFPRGFVRVNLATRETEYLPFTFPTNDLISPVLAEDSVWLVTMNHGRIGRVDLATREVAAVNPLPLVDPKLLHAEGSIFALTPTEIMRLDATTGELTATIPMQGGLKATIGRHRGLWVITEAGSLHRVDLESNQVSHSVDALDVELLDERLFDPAIAQVDDHIWIVLHSGEVIAVPIV